MKQAENLFDTRGAGGDDILAKEPGVNNVIMTIALLLPWPHKEIQESFCGYI